MFISASFLIHTFDIGEVLREMKRMYYRKNHQMNMTYNRSNDYDRVKKWRANKKKQGWQTLDLVVPKSLAVQLLKLKHQFKQDHPRIYKVGAVQ